MPGFLWPKEIQSPFLNTRRPFNKSLKVPPYTVYFYVLQNVRYIANIDSIVL